MNWNEYFYYDETSPSCLRWKVKRKSAEKDSVAGWDDQCSGYYRVQVCRKQHFVHRIVWEMFNGVIPIEKIIDHVDNNRKNNKIQNLQLSTVKQNTRKRLKRSIKLTSQYKGVSWNSSRNKWNAQIKIDGKSYNLGSYDYEDKAALAYNSKAIEAFGEFSILNLIK